MHPRMRYDEPGLAHDGVAIEQKVEVERARRVWKAATAAVACLDALQRLEQGRGGKRGVEQRDGIDELRLLGVPERLRAVQRRSLYEGRLRDAPQVLERLFQLLDRLSEVRAHSHVGKRHTG